MGEDVNRYAITQGSLNNSNYDISFIEAELSIDQRAITLAAEAVSKIYGEADPTLSVQIAEGNLAFSDTLADVAGELSRARQDAAEFCGQRDEARLATLQQIADGRQLPGAADERSQRRGQ